MGLPTANTLDRALRESVFNPRDYSSLDVVVPAVGLLDAHARHAAACVKLRDLWRADFWDPGTESVEGHEMALELQRRFTEMGLGSGWYRSRAEITALFGGLEILPPGVVELDDWWPTGPPPNTRCIDERLILGGLGRKPEQANNVHPIGAGAHNPESASTGRTAR